MASTNTMKEVLANLRFDKKIKESAVLGESYKDVKSFVQFYAEVREQLEARVKGYEKAIADYKSKERDVRLSEDGQHILIRISALEQAQEDLLAFWNAYDAAIRLQQTKGALQQLEDLKRYEDNWGTKEGVDQVRRSIQDNDMLLALVLSTPKGEKAKASED